MHVHRKLIVTLKYPDMIQLARFYLDLCPTSILTPPSCITPVYRIILRASSLRLRRALWYQ